MDVDARLLTPCASLIRMSKIIIMSSVKMKTKNTRFSLTPPMPSRCLIMASMVLLDVFTACTGNTAPASETESLSVLRQNAPAIERAIAADPGLREVVGAEKWPHALQRLAEFSKNTNTDYREALRIIGDTVPRLKSPVGNIQLDGNPSEWSDSIPPPDVVRRHDAFARSLWAQGAAAVVRQDHLYLMVGLTNAVQHFAQRNNTLRLAIDCKGDQTWDVSLSLSFQKGGWTIKQMPFGSKWSDAQVAMPIQGFVGPVAELRIPIRDFVPITEAKPIWTLYLQVPATDPNGKLKWPETKEIPVFNENAREGVAAWPYLRTFLCLCADKPLDDFELTAAAIAIMSATMYLESDEEVRQKIRADNADFLELARSIAAWQAEAGMEYRLKKYPLEAQLAWAGRIWDWGKFLETTRKPGKKNNLENYYWNSTSVETLKKLKAMALREGLTNVSLAQCSERIDKWALAKEKGTYSPGDYKVLAQKATNPNKAKRAEEQRVRAEKLMAEADVVGSYRGEPVTEFRLKHSESILKQIETNGFYIGSCGHHTTLSMDLMRSMGIAPLTFRVWSGYVDGSGGHAWPARYDPVQNLWQSYQSWRADEQPYLFFINRPTVFCYANEAQFFPQSMSYKGSRPFPLDFCRRVKGSEVKSTSQNGIPTQEVREWMLTPSF